MNFASLNNEDDYFETLKNFMDPMFLGHTKPHEFHSNVVQFKQSYVELNDKIREAEDTVLKFESDLNVLSQAGERLVSNDMKQKLRDLCEEYITQNDLHKIKQNIEELYNTRKSYVKALAPIMHQFDNITCPVCFDQQVYVYNESCGHTLCIDCSQKSKKCPMCRALTHYKPLIYNG